MKIGDPVIDPVAGKGLITQVLDKSFQVTYESGKVKRYMTHYANPRWARRLQFTA